MPTTTQGSRFDSRGEVTAQVLSRFGGRAVMESQVGARMGALVRPGWDLWARNVDNGALTHLGWIDADAVPRALTDVPLADGIYEIEIRPARFAWEGCRGRQVVTVTISGWGAITGLPAVQDLAAEVAGGVTRISWRVAEEQGGSFDFGVWFSTTTPVDTSGAPDAVVTHYPGIGGFQVSRTQSVGEYVAVATRSGGSKGEVSEIALPWSTVVPASPADQFAYQGDAD